MSEAPKPVLETRALRKAFGGIIDYEHRLAGDIEPYLGLGWYQRHGASMNRFSGFARPVGNR